MSSCDVAGCSNDAETFAFLRTDVSWFAHEIHVKLCREHYDEVRRVHRRPLPCALSSFPLVSTDVVSTDVVVVSAMVHEKERPIDEMTARDVSIEVGKMRARMTEIAAAIDGRPGETENSVMSRSASVLREDEPPPDWPHAEAVFRQLAPHAVEGLPGVTWHIILAPPTLRLRFVVPHPAATIRIRKWEYCGIMGRDEACFELWSTDKSRCVDMLALLGRVDTIPGWQAEVSWRCAPPAENAAWVDVKLTAKGVLK